MLSPFDPNLPIYLPCTTILVDDDEIFLRSLRKNLGRENAVLAFSETGKALQHIHQAQKIVEDRFNFFTPYRNTETEDNLILLESSKIRSLATSEDRYKGHLEQWPSSRRLGQF